MGSFGPNGHLGTGVDFEMRRHRIARVVMDQLRQAHARHEESFFNVAVAHLLQSALDTRVGHFAPLAQRASAKPAMQAERVRPAGHAKNARRLELRIAFDDRSRKPGPMAGLDDKAHIHLLGGVALVRFITNCGGEEPVGAQHGLHLSGGGGERLLVKIVAQVQRRGADQLVAGGRRHGSLRGDMAQEELRLGVERERHTVRGVLAGNGDVFVAARGKQPLNGEPQPSLIEPVAGTELEGNPDLLRRDGLLLWIEADGHNRPAVQTHLRLSRPKGGDPGAEHEHRQRGHANPLHTWS